MSIDPTTGEVTLNDPFDAENPTDADGDGVLEFEVLADDGNGGTDVATVTITVGDVNEAPELLTPFGLIADENTTDAGTVFPLVSDPDGDEPIFLITGGVDAGLLAIDPVTGAVSFLAAPDFEAPADADGDNVYEIDITVEDGNGGSTTESGFVVVAPVDEAPSFVPSTLAQSVDENTTAGGAIVATDPENGPLTYSIAGGEDAGAVTIDPTTGVVLLNTSPNFESPSDFDLDGVLEFDVSVTDGTNVVTESVTFTVVDVNEAPVFLSLTDDLGAFGNFTFDIENGAVVPANGAVPTATQVETGVIGQLNAFRSGRGRHAGVHADRGPERGR